MRGLVVLVCGSCMQDVGIRNELQVSDLEDHVQGEALRRLLEDLHCLGLLGGEGRDLSSLDEARRGPEVVRVDLEHETVGRLALDEGNDGALHVRELALAHLALSVEVPVGLGEGACNVGAVLLQVVPEVVAGDDVALASLEGAVQAAEADQAARRVDVEVLTGRGAVDADLVDVVAGEVAAFDVLDVAEQVALAILRDGVAQVSADHEVCRGGDLDGPLRDGEALEDVEAGSVKDLVAERQERRLKRDGQVDGGLAVAVVGWEVG